MTSLHTQFPVGTLVYIARGSPINHADEVGVVFEVYRIGQEEGISIVFESGGYDGFSAQDVAIFGVAPVPGWPEPHPDVRDYAFRGVLHVQADHRKGVFSRAFSAARSALLPAPATPQ